MLNQFGYQFEFFLVPKTCPKSLYNINHNPEQNQNATLSALLMKILAISWRLTCLLDLSLSASSTPDTSLKPDHGLSPRIRWDKLFWV